MADYLIQQGYKDQAAVVAGSVLEEHLRKLCDKHGIVVVKADGTPKKADALNSELTAAGAYSKLEQKHDTAWLILAATGFAQSSPSSLASFSLTIAAAQTEVKAGSEVIVKVTITNLSNRQIVIGVTSPDNSRI